MANAAHASGTTADRVLRAWKSHVYFWDTDLSWLYVGDGVTLGGIPVPKGGQTAVADITATALADVTSTAIADVDATSLPADGAIAGLTISNPPTQAEVQALQAECEKLRDALAANNTSTNAIKTRLIETLNATNAANARLTEALTQANLALARLRAAKVIAT